MIKNEVKNMNRFEQFNMIIDSNLGANEKMLLLIIYRYYNQKKGYAYPSKTTIMNCMGLKNESSYYKAKKSLEEKGILKTTVIKGIGNEYRINYESLINNQHTNCKSPHLQLISTPPLQNVSTKIKEKTTEIDININNGYYDWMNEL